MITVKDVRKTYQMGTTRIDALRGVSLKIRAGEFVFVIGPSGSGKTTLLDIIGALSRPTSGEVLLDGKDLSEFDDFQLSMFRRKKIGFIFQAFNLIPSISALENVLLPHVPEGVKPEHTRRAKELLGLVGLSDRMQHRPSQLSGGQAQRVAIARSLINDPLIVLADEPTGEVDHATGSVIFEYMRKMNREEKKTFVVVTHDTEYIKKGDRILHIRDGVIVKDGGGLQGFRKRRTA